METIQNLKDLGVLYLKKPLLLLFPLPSLPLHTSHTNPFLLHYIDETVVWLQRGFGIWGFL